MRNLEFVAEFVGAFLRARSDGDQVAAFSVAQTARESVGDVARRKNSPAERSVGHGESRVFSQQGSASSASLVRPFALGARNLAASAMQTMIVVATHIFNVFG